jgi:uncharacterized protein (TIGR01244 family)
MMNRLFAILMLTAVSAVAWAGEAETNSTLTVDLTSVVDTGVVQPVDGLTSAGQPDAAAFGVFAEQGYTTVIDLRTEGEDRGLDESGVVEELGMDYVSLPIGRDAISFDSARSLEKLISEADGPVLIHCGSGNRVGALLALRKSLAGADDEAALEYGKEGGMTGLESRVRDVLDGE